MDTDTNKIDDGMKDESLPSKEKVEVNKEGLDKLLATVEQQSREIKKLTEIADRGRLAHWESQHKEDTPRQYHLSAYDGKIIIAWEMKINQVWKDEVGLWKENQQIELTFVGGEKKMLPYVEFGTKTERVSAKLLSTIQKGSKTIFEVETADGEKIVIDSIYVN